MRNGRTGVWKNSDGTVGVGAVVSIPNNNKLVVLDASTEEEVTIERPSFHKIDGSTHESAANFIREMTGTVLGVGIPRKVDTTPVSLGYSRVSDYDAPESDTVAAVVVNGNKVEFSGEVVDALRQMFRQIVNKKKVTGSYVIGRGTKKATKKATAKK